MIKAEWENIISQQVDFILKEKGITRLDLSAREIWKYRYLMALKLLEELG